MSIKLTTYSRKLHADILTPVGIYLRIRDRYPNALLLESSDYHGDEHSFSYICCDPIARFTLEGKTISTEIIGETPETIEITEGSDVMKELANFRDQFDAVEEGDRFVTNGLFGYTAYDSVRNFEDIEIDSYSSDDYKIPDAIYQLFGVIIVFDHFKDEVNIYHHSQSGVENKLDELVTLLKNKDYPEYAFECANNETSDFTDEEYMDIVQKGKDHCQRGDVFQIVLSRRFRQNFKGDEFNVYRKLRSINPSPYLFYFDYGNFRLMGSSPEAQIVVKDQNATIYPIAGTFKRTGNDKDDYDSAKRLFDDPKENSEHVMLVDLARNDLSRHGSNVTVETFKEIQYYSHVIHMVSKVTGTLDEDVVGLQLVADTFPAGTLSGAPKHMAMQLINKYESGNRGYYGGAIGFMGLNGDFNHAIMIRTILSKKNTLFYQAGAGVVAKSVIENEKQEVYNKIAALRKAIESAEEVVPAKALVEGGVS